MSLTKSKSKSRKNRQSKRKTKINKKNNLRGGAKSMKSTLTKGQQNIRDYGPSGYGPIVKPFNYQAANAQKASNQQALSIPKPVNPNAPVKGFGFIKPKQFKPSI